MTSSSRNSDPVACIVQAAAQLFSRQGYHGTSTREIARVAEISENTLFRHFERKEEIFWAVLRSRLTGLKLREELKESIAAGAEPSAVLPQMMAQLVDTVILKPELMRLIAVGLIELNWKTQVVCCEYLSPILSTVNRYLEASVEDGRLRKLDPSMVTAALITTVLVHAGLSKLMAGAAPPCSDSREAIQGYTKFWLEILLPPGTGTHRDQPDDRPVAAEAL